MLVFTPEGPRSIDDRDVIAVYRGGGDARYSFATLVLANGREVSGAVEHAALANLEHKLGVTPEAA